MATVFYGDIKFTKDVEVVGKIKATPGTASNELATKGQVDAAQAYSTLRTNHTGTQLASTISNLEAAVDAIVDPKIEDLIGGAPGTFDTLKEIADWIASDESGTAALVNRVTDAEADIDGLQDQIDSIEAGIGGGKIKSTIGNGTDSSFSISHTFNTLDISVQVYEIGSTQTVFPVVTRTDNSHVLIDFAGTVIPSNSHRVLIEAY